MNKNNTRYSKPFKQLYSELKAVDVKRIQKLTEQETIQFIKEQNEFNRKIGNKYTAMDLPIRNLRGEVEQIFIQDEKLLEFLETTEIQDLKDFRQIVEPDKMYILNLPNRERSVGVWLEPADHDSLHIKDEKEMELLFVIDGCNNIVADVNVFNKKRGGCVALDEATVKEDPEGDRIMNLAVNTFVYITAFPDMVRDGLPKGCVIEYGKSSIKKVLKTEPTLIEHGKNGVAPHLRRGHFRYLSSEMFTKKRGQWVFVKASFVGAKDVKTVEGDN